MSSPAPRPPCDPGFGSPEPRHGCPDADPETGVLTGTGPGDLVLRPFRMLHSDDEGRAYAREHGLEFPFSNDYFDAPTGDAHAIHLDLETVCTGIIRVGYRSPLEDHVVDCAELVRVALHEPGDLKVAVWCDDGTVVQVSELYRP